MIRLAIFDCDGTLVDGQANVCMAMERCFTAAALPPPSPEASRRVVGLSMIEAMQVLLPEGDAALHARLADGYRSEFHAMRGEGLVDEPLYAGIADMLDGLEADGWLLGVATGKSDRGLGLCLEAHGIRQRFVTLQTADRHPSKPHPSMIEQALADAGAEPGAALMIGDTSYDMAMAKAAGVTGIGVTWGYHPEGELRDAGAAHVAHHPRDILAIARSLG